MRILLRLSVLLSQQERPQSDLRALEAASDDMLRFSFSFCVKEQTNRNHGQQEQHERFAERARYAGWQDAVSGVCDKKLRSRRKQE